MNVFGYETKTTFWDDFTIADTFGVKAVEDTYKRAFSEWKSNVIYFTELVLVLNWKIWQWYEKDDSLAKLYNKFWEEADGYAMDNFEGDDLTYFIRTTD